MLLLRKLHVQPPAGLQVQQKHNESRKALLHTPSSAATAQTVFKLLQPP